MSPTFAGISDSLENLQQLGLNLLTVAGAFVLGYVITWIGLYQGCKRTIKRQFPVPLQRFFRALGGVALAILVALFVFGEGGWGTGWGDDVGIGGPSEEQEGKPSPSEEERPEPKVPEDDPPEENPGVGPGKTPDERRLEVTILSGYDSLGRYYRLEGRDRLSFEELKDRLRESMTAAEEPIKAISILVYKNSADRDGPVVTRLATWAGENGLSVNFPPLSDRDRPD